MFAMPIGLAKAEVRTAPAILARVSNPVSAAANVSIQFGGTKVLTIAGNANTARLPLLPLRQPWRTSPTAVFPGGPNFMCTSTPMLPLSTNKTTIKNAINAMVAQGATGVGEGAAWGWRALSPGAPFTEGRPYSTKNNQKFLVLMTDGQNTYYPNSNFLKSLYDIYGYVGRGQLGTTSTALRQP